MVELGLLYHFHRQGQLGAGLGDINGTAALTSLPQYLVWHP
jgi:hypothetical protein